MAATDRPTIFFTGEAEFRTWLESNHANSEGVWAKFAKKDAGIVSLNHAGALRQALCFGWIDGQARRLDDTYYLQGFTPRRARSTWSKRNVALVAELTEQGLMHPAGQAQIDQAKADGRWELAYAGPAEAELPQDFLAELAKNPKATEFFATLDKQNQFAIYLRLHNAVKPDVRARRIAKLVDLLAAGEKPQR